MTKKEIIAESNNISKYINHNSLFDAFKLLSKRVITIDDWDLSQRLEQLQNTYKLMIHYSIEGANDPQQETLYTNLCNDMLNLNDEIECKLRCIDENSLYFSTMRFVKNAKFDISKLLNEYVSHSEQLYFLSEVNKTDKNIKQKIEQLIDTIFCSIWVNVHMSKSTISIITDFFDQYDESYSDLKSSVISAMFLSLLSYYDRTKLIFLLELYAKKRNNISLKALIISIIILNKYSQRIKNDSFINKIIDSISEQPDFDSDLKTIIFNFIRTRDTDRINKKMKDEVIPEIMRLQPEIIKKFKTDLKDVDPLTMEENPEWQDMLQKNGLSDKLKELTELQLDGGDIMMVAFSNLKNFSFFNNISNWFLPFDINHTELSALKTIEYDSLLNMIGNDSLMCDSDKYSFGLAMLKMPEVQRNMIIGQLDSQLSQLKEANESSLKKTTDNQNSKEIVKYIRDIYRFFKLFNRRLEFNDPFKSPINFVQIPFLGTKLTDYETLQIIGEFYFTRGYYADAVSIFEILVSQDYCGQLLQKIGFCYKSMNQFNKAINYYNKAELIENSDNCWLFKQLASCYKLTNDYEKAEQYYRKALDKKETDISLMMSVAYCLYEQKRYTDALQYYYKADYFANSNRAWRQIAWCELLLGNYDKSQSYYDKILSESPMATDYMNFGHLNILNNNIKKAIYYYEQSIKAENLDKFIEFFESDIPQLIAHGVDKKFIYIILDELKYKQED